MLKADLEYLIKNGSTTSISEMALETGLSRKYISTLLSRHKIVRFRNYAKPDKPASADTIANAAARSQAAKQHKRTPWPKVNATMDNALRGRTYGKSKLSTTSPRQCFAVYCLTAGTIKSSMG